MLGNVWEWCADWYGDYDLLAVTDPTGTSSGSLRVVRGGGWFNPAGYCRVAFRCNDDPSLRNFGFGFRVARSSVP